METILLVDDEQFILNSLKRLFRHKDYNVKTALSGAEGLDILAQEKVDLIVSDMRMPEMSGSEFLSKAKDKYPLVERILLTGYADMESTVSAINDGGIFGYLSKPWDDTEVVSLVESALDRRKRNKLKNAALHTYKKQKDALSIEVERKEREMAQSAAFVDFAHKQLEERKEAQERELALSDQFVDQAYRELKDSYTVTEHVLVNLIDLRFKGQRLFGISVVEVVDHLLNGLNMDEESRKVAISAAKLHALGKIGLPDDILKTPINKLSDDQRLIYQGYPETGACSLMAIAPYQSVATLLFQQKEYCDGSGFPHGLKGEEISDLAQILTIAIDYAEIRFGYTTGSRMNHEAALNMMQAMASRYNRNLLALMASLTLKVEDLEADTEIVLPTRSLRPGMTLQKDILSSSGILLLRKGATLDDDSITHLLTLEQNMKDQLNVSVKLAQGEL